MTPSQFKIWLEVEVSQYLISNERRHNFKICIKDNKSYLYYNSLVLSFVDLHVYSGHIKIVDLG